MEPVRLQKYLADTGVCSRRAAEALIVAHEVWVNGVQAVLGQKITPGVDKVTVQGKVARNNFQPKPAHSPNPIEESGRAPEWTDINRANRYGDF